MYQIIVIECRETCNEEETVEVENEEVLRYWSNSTMWKQAGLEKPSDNADAIIPASWKLVVDEETAKINNLEVRGQLIIPQNVDKTVINAE